MTQLRQDEIRSLVQRYFKSSLDQFLERLNDTGFPERSFDAMRQEMAVHENAVEGEDLLSDHYFDREAFCEASGLTSLHWEENAFSLRREMRKARTDMLRRVLESAESLEHYSYDEVHTATKMPSLPASAPLGRAIDDFMDEHSRQWPEKTTKQVRAYLTILLEQFGSERLLAAISKQDASEVKKVLQALPASRNTKPALKDLPLSEVVKASGHKIISPKTINSHIDAFRRFFDWAERHGHAPHKLFEGMKVPRAKDAATERRPFSKDQTRLIYNELTSNPSGLVRSESHKWAALLGLFTGARLNEICQLELADIQQNGDIWCLNITDEGDNNKRVKAKASRRKVPLHSKLIQLGFLDFMESRKKGQRLFPDYSYSANVGYGRSLGRWYNESFLPKLGLKEPSLVFHSLRHTMVTRLAQAGVPEPIIQGVVGHAREGVTQEAYFKDGYTLKQLKDAIERFEIE